jgi:hypothetical protein
MVMTPFQEPAVIAPDESWERDFPSPSRVEDFVWPEGAELRGSINLVDQKMIDRVEVAAEWERVRDELLRMLAE